MGLKQGVSPCLEGATGKRAGYCRIVLKITSLLLYFLRMPLRSLVKLHKQAPARPTLMPRPNSFASSQGKKDPSFPPTPYPLIHTLFSTDSLDSFSFIEIAQPRSN
jgi:hypothetical protein